MKAYLYVSMWVCLITGFLACKKNPPEIEPNDTSAIDPFPVHSPYDAIIYFPFPQDFDFFADLPVTFPESANYRVSGIDVVDSTGKNVAISARFSYNLASGRLAYKLFQNYRRTINSSGDVGMNYAKRYPVWRHNYVFDAQNRLINEKSDKTGWGVDEYSPVDIVYEYEGNLLKKIIKKTAGYGNYGTITPNRVTTYRYESNRRVGATILNYYHGGALANLQYPVDSTRRKFFYTNNDQTIAEQDSNWYVPCYPNIPCINKFMSVDSTRRQFDAKGNLLTIYTSVPSYLYPKGNTTFQYEYKGPDGLLSRIINVDARLVYQFCYLEK